MLSLFEHIFIIISYSSYSKSNSPLLPLNLHPTAQNPVWENVKGLLVTPSGTEPERTLYLAIRESSFIKLFEQEIGQICDFRHNLAQSSTINWLHNNENTSFQAIERIEFSIITWR
jgi:hypothetical protein